MAAPILDDHELNSGVWKKIVAFLEQELAERRGYNDAQTLTEVETAIVRGEIKHIKKMLRLPEAGKPLEKPAVNRTRF